MNWWIDDEKEESFRAPRGGIEYCEIFRSQKSGEEEIARGAGREIEREKKESVSGAREKYFARFVFCFANKTETTTNMQNHFVEWERMLACVREREGKVLIRSPLFFFSFV